MKRICSHHIGGRAGSRSFPKLPEFEGDMINVIYDADADCLKQIEERNKTLESQLVVLPYCVGGNNIDKTTFNINYDPYASSLREMNEKCANWYFYFRREAYDYIVRDTFKTIEERNQQLFTLDQILKNDTSITPPDILSLDAQGVEYEILEGSPKVLSSNVLAVITEVEFHQLYKGQKLFGDISSLLTDRGFHFVKFTRDFAEYSPYRNAIGLRSEGFHTVGEALFFRRIEDLEIVKDDTLRSTMLDKLAFVAIVFDQFEYAIECLSKKGKCPNEPDNKEHCYIRMLREIEAEVKKIDKCFPPVFSNKYTWQKSKSRFDVGGETEFSPVNEDIPADSEQEDSNIEKILREYGLDNQADLIKHRRILQSHSVKQVQPSK